MALETTQKIRKWGDSLGLRIPSAHARFLEIKEGDEVNIAVSRGKFIVTPQISKPTISSLLIKFTEEQKHEIKDYRSNVEWD